MAQSREASRQDERIVAVFDVDETLIRIKSMFAFLTFALSQREGTHQGKQHADAIAARMRQAARYKSRAEVNREFYRLFAGWPAAEIRSLAVDWFASVDEPGLYHGQVLARWRDHKARGDLMVMLSGSARHFLSPLADHLGADHLLAIDLEEDAQGHLTGEISGIQTIGNGKRDALEHLLKQLDGTPMLFGYGDHASDQPFLALCDHPIAVLSPEAAAQPAPWHRDMASLVVC